MPRSEDMAVAGAIFGCTDQTESECLSRKLFGLKGTSWNTVSQVMEGMPLWLFNFDRKILRGVFFAAGPGTYNMNPLALQGDPVNGSAFPAQCSVTWNELSEPVELHVLQRTVPQIFYRENRFRFSLGRAEVRALLTLFRESKQPAVSSHASAYLDSRSARSFPPPQLPTPPVLPTDGFDEPRHRFQRPQRRTQPAPDGFQAAPIRSQPAHARGQWSDHASRDSQQLQSYRHAAGYSSQPGRQDESHFAEPRVASPPMPPALPCGSMHDSVMSHRGGTAARQHQQAVRGRHDFGVRPQPMKVSSARQRELHPQQQQQQPQQRRPSFHSTLSINNLPYGFSADAVVDLLDGPGQLQDQYDFVLLTHVPRHNSWWAIVNFTTQLGAQQLKTWLHGQSWLDLTGMPGSGNGIVWVSAYETSGIPALQQTFGNVAAFHEGAPSQYHIESEQPTFFYDTYAPDPSSQLLQQQQHPSSMVLPPRSVTVSGVAHRDRVVSHSGGQPSEHSRDKDAVVRPQYRGESGTSHQRTDSARSHASAAQSKPAQAPQPRPVQPAAKPLQPAAKPIQPVAKSISRSTVLAASAPQSQPPPQKASANARMPQPAAQKPQPGAQKPQPPLQRSQPASASRATAQKRSRSPEQSADASDGSKRKFTPIVWDPTGEQQQQLPPAKSSPEPQPVHRPSPRPARGSASADRATVGTPPSKRTKQAGQPQPPAHETSAQPHKHKLPAQTVVKAQPTVHRERQPVSNAFTQPAQPAAKKPTAGGAVIKQPAAERSKAESSDVPALVQHGVKSVPAAQPPPHAGHASTAQNGMHAKDTAAGSRPGDQPPASTEHTAGAARAEGSPEPAAQVPEATMSDHEPAGLVRSSSHAQEADADRWQARAEGQSASRKLVKGKRPVRAASAPPGESSAKASEAAADTAINGAELSGFGEDFLALPA